MIITWKNHSSIWNVPGNIGFIFYVDGCKILDFQFLVGDSDLSEKQ